MGRFEGFYEFNLKPWDICAGALIANEAGAICSDWNGSSLPQSGKRILCNNKKVHTEMINILNKDFYKTFYDLK
jgi:myo-inositol-1(or 4)-monophosphatase